MKKAFYVLTALLISSAAQAETRTVLVNPSQTKTLDQPHATGANCNTGQVRVSVISSPKLGSISISDKKVKGCNVTKISRKIINLKPHLGEIGLCYNLLNKGKSTIHVGVKCSN